MTAQRSEIDRHIRAMIVDLLEEEVDPESIPAGLPIFRDGLGLDSMSAVELMTQIEDKYGVYIDDDDFDVFDSLERLVTYVDEHAGTA